MVALSAYRGGRRLGGKSGDSAVARFRAISARVLPADEFQKSSPLGSFKIAVVPVCSLSSAVLKPS